MSWRGSARGAIPTALGGPWTTCQRFPTCLTAVAATAGAASINQPACSLMGSWAHRRYGCQSQITAVPPVTPWASTPSWPPPPHLKHTRLPGLAAASAAGTAGLGRSWACRAPTPSSTLLWTAVQNQHHHHQQQEQQQSRASRRSLVPGAAGVCGVLPAAALCAARARGWHRRFRPTSMRCVVCRCQPMAPAVPASAPAPSTLPTAAAPPRSTSSPKSWGREAPIRLAPIV
mmetsp:Transcript_12010/g.25829  ORF Transcript_12010/g.25829 Transcript_12010/m.25829 type:complete len:231 (-) Transcript_12010:1250-1942(-)